MCEDKNKFTLALIDSRLLTRISISHLLTTFSDDFVIQSYSGINEFMVDYLDCSYRAEAILINIGSARVSENNISKGIQWLKRKHSSLPLVLLSDRDDLLIRRLWRRLQLSGVAGVDGVTV